MKKTAIFLPMFKVGSRVLFIPISSCDSVFNLVFENISSHSFPTPHCVSLSLSRPLSLSLSVKVDKSAPSSLPWYCINTMWVSRTLTL